jgi:hypothetical protein
MPIYSDGTCTLQPNRSKPVAAHWHHWPQFSLPCYLSQLVRYLLDAKLLKLKPYSIPATTG